MNNIDNIIQSLDLQPHPEGGYFKETYRSIGDINTDSLDSAYNSTRSYSTCIYFLLTSDTFSAFHRIKQDEIWHFYDGATIKLHTISPEGKHSEYKIGRNFTVGEVPQLVVEGGDWFAAEVLGEDTYALVGCTVSPGFDFSDFELPNRKELTSKFPQHLDIITKLTHN